ncbi:MAG: hypothetical protein Q7S05_02840 [bacterium]|nr:hypothetical protein [bacterium]
MNRITVAVAIEYASNRNCTGLAPATISTLEAASAFLNNQRENDSVLAYCNADLRSAMTTRETESKKSEILRKLLKTPVKRVVVEAGNSIEEAKNIRGALVQNGIQPRKIIIFCDIQHRRRLRIIWPYVFPGIEIEIRTGRYIFGGDYRQIFLRHEFTWWLANVIGLFAMRSFGIERVASIKEP